MPPIHAERGGSGHHEQHTEYTRCPTAVDIKTHGDTDKEKLTREETMALLHAVKMMSRETIERETAGQVDNPKWHAVRSIIITAS